MKITNDKREIVDITGDDPVKYGDDDNHQYVQVRIEIHEDEDVLCVDIGNLVLVLTQEQLDKMYYYFQNT